MMSTLTVHCKWEDEMVMERTGYPPSYAMAKKMKSLTLLAHGCPRANLQDCSSLFLKATRQFNPFTTVSNSIPMKPLHKTAGNSLYRTQLLISMQHLFRHTWKFNNFDFLSFLFQCL